MNYLARVARTYSRCFSISSFSSAKVFKTNWNSLLPSPVNKICAAGLKRHVAVHRRCPSCQILRIDGRLSVRCEEHPRHNQMQFGRTGQKRIHKPFPWRWPDPFDKKYGSKSTFYEDRYSKAFE